MLRPVIQRDGFPTVKCTSIKNEKLNPTIHYFSSLSKEDSEKNYYPQVRWFRRRTLGLGQQLFSGLRLILMKGYKQDRSLPKLSFCFKLCSFLGLQWKWTCLLFCTFTKAKADSWKITAAPCDFTTRNALIFPASVILKLTSRHKNWCLHALVRFTNYFRLFAANIPCFATGRGRLGHKSWWLRRRKSCLS